MDHIEAILKNVAWSDRYDEDSFNGALHERAVWDTEKCWELEASFTSLPLTQGFSPADVSPVPPLQLHHGQSRSGLLSKRCLQDR